MEPSRYSIREEKKPQFVKDSIEFEAACVFSHILRRYMGVSFITSYLSRKFFVDE
jgi:hypothetical protein